MEIAEVKVLANVMIDYRKQVNEVKKERSILKNEREEG